MSASASRPLAVTMGEPAGIGPELIARVWQDRGNTSIRPFVYYGAIEALQAIAPNLTVVAVDSPNDAVDVWTDAIPAINIDLKNSPTPGTLDTQNGQTVITAIDRAVSDALNNQVSGIVTAPIHKAALYAAGFDTPGHTEYLARLCKQPDDSSIMMLAAGDLKVIPVTVHVPLKDVAKTLRAESIIHAGLVAAHDLKHRFGIEKPKIAVAGLNPHAGEDGTIGMEEGTHITPAIWALKDAGLDVTGPLPADTLFHAEARQQFDLVLCMYHDQALIPIKTVDFWGGVNVTLGLPIIRTSPDHGTALDLAGKSIARTDSILAAIRLAEQMADNQSSHAQDNTND